MKPTNRLVVAAVFLLVAAVIFVLVSKADLSTVGRGEETAVPTVPAQLFSVDPLAEVTRVQVKDNATGDIFVAESTDDSWAILEAPEGSDTELGVDAERITNALATIPLVRPSRTLSSVEALATYGLGEEAQYTIILTMGGKEYTLYVGSKNPSASDYYVQLSEFSDVYLINIYNLDPMIELLTNPPYIQPTPDPNVTPSATPKDSTSG